MSQCVNDFVGTLIGQKAPAEHQDHFNHHRRDGAEQQRRRQDDQQFVAKRPDRDPSDDRQFTLSGEPTDIGGGDRGVVNHHAGRLHAGPRCGCAHVIHRGRSQFRQRGNVIQQPDQTACHTRLLFRGATGVKPTGGNSRPRSALRRASRLAGGFADVLPDLPQRTGRLRNQRRGHLEVVDLTRPDAHLGRHPSGRESPRRQSGVVQQHL